MPRCQLGRQRDLDRIGLRELDAVAQGLLRHRYDVVATFGGGAGSGDMNLSERKCSCDDVRRASVSVVSD